MSTGRMIHQFWWQNLRGLSDFLASCEDSDNSDAMPVLVLPPFFYSLLEVLELRLPLVVSPGDWECTSLLVTTKVFSCGACEKVVVYGFIICFPGGADFAFLIDPVVMITSFGKDTTGSSLEWRPQVWVSRHCSWTTWGTDDFGPWPLLSSCCSPMVTLCHRR